jgi:hypothetical protein
MTFKSNSFGSGVLLIGALAIFGAGCAAAPGGEDVASTEQGLSFSPWTEVTSSPFESVGQFGPTLFSEWDTHFQALTVAYDNNVYQRTYNSVGGSWSGWNAIAPTQAFAKPGAVSWLGPGGVGSQKNVVIAYVGSDHALHIGAWMNTAGCCAWSTMSDATFAVAQPALAYANGWLYLFAKKSDNIVYFKRNFVTAFAYNPANWSSSWTAVGSIPMSGIAAAAVSSTTITVAATANDASTNCRVVNITASTGAIVGGGWTFLSTSTCAWEAMSTPAMTAIGTGNTSGAQVVAFGTDNNLYTASTGGNNTSWSWTEVPPGSCTPGGANPGITQYNTGGPSESLAIGTACSLSENLSWLALSTP